MKQCVLMLLILMALAGCSLTPDVRYVTEPLPLPERPVLPSVTAKELGCLTDPVYERLETRQLDLRQYSEDLEAVIRSTYESRDW